MRRLFTTTFLCVLLGSLFPLVAHAEGVLPWETPSPSKFVATFSLKTHNGTSIAVEGWGRNVKLVVVRASKSGHGSAEVAEYLTQGKATADGIVARFGDLGKVAVRFKSSRSIGRTTLPFPLRPWQRECGTRLGPDRLGLFTGTIRFRGEGGYVSVRAHRAKGFVGKPPKIGCPSREPHVFEETCAEYAKSGGTAPSVFEQAQSDGRSTYFVAGPGEISGSNIATKTFDLFLAGLLEEDGKLTISRSIIALRSPSTLAVGPGPSLAVTPPSPFAGSGVFQTNPDGTTTWNGTLSGLFLGEPEPVPLAGAGFSGKLCE